MENALNLYNYFHKVNMLVRSDPICDSNKGLMSSLAR